MMNFQPSIIENAFKSFVKTISLSQQEAKTHYYNTILPLISDLSEIRRSEKNTYSKAILDAFFQACVVVSKNENDSATREKASQLFQRILTSSQTAPDPGLFIQEEMYRTMMKCWNANFLEQENYQLFLKASSYAERKISAAHPSQDPRTCRRLGEFVGLYAIAHRFPAYLEDSTTFVEASDYRMIDDLVAQVICHSEIRDSLTEMTAYLESIEGQLNDTLYKLDAGEIKQELLAVILADVFWTPMLRLVQSDSGMGISDQIEQILSEITEENSLCMIDAAAGKILMANLSAKCEPKELKYLFDLVAKGLGQGAEDEKVLEEFCRICGVNAEEIGIVEWFRSLQDNSTTREDAIAEASAKIVLFGAQRYLLENLEHIALTRKSQRDLKNFYSTDLEAIGNYALQNTISGILEATTPLQTDLTKFLNFVKEEIHNFNSKRGKLPEIGLDPYRLYQLIIQIMSEEANHLRLGDLDLLFFPPECPKTENKVLKLTEIGLSKLKRENRFKLLENLMVSKERLFKLLEESARQQEKENLRFDEELKKGSIATLKDLKIGTTGIPMDEKTGKAIKEFDLTLGAKAESLGLVPANIKTGKQETGVQVSKQEHLYEQVDSLVLGIQENFNDSSFELLFREMVQDQQISSQVAKEFETNWRSGDRTLFGEDIASGKGVLSEERRRKIILEARQISTANELKVGLSQFRRKLNQDLMQGRVVGKEDVIKKRYSGFFSHFKSKFKELSEPHKKQWIQGYNRIVADAVLAQEMKSVEANPHKVTGGLIENTLLKLLNYGDAEEDLDVRCKRHQAEVQVLKTLMEGQGISGRDFDQVKNKVEHAKFEARLKASNVSADQFSPLWIVIKTTEAVYEMMLKEAEAYKDTFTGLSPDHPKQHRDWLLEIKSSHMDYYLKQEITRILEKVSKKEIFNDLIKQKPEEIQKYICSELDPFFQHSLGEGALSEDVESNLLPYAEFHRKWKDKIKGEMVQGQADKQEIFGKGVCAALSCRWAVNDQKNPSAKAEDIGDPQKLKVSAKDRLVQGFTAFAHRFKSTLLKNKKVDIKNKMDLEAIEANFPEPIREGLGIKKVEKFLEKKGSPDSVEKKSLPFTKKEIKEFGTELKSQVNELKKSHGVFLMNIYFRDEGAHRIYLRYDASAKKPIYRLGEPNIGIMELSTEEEFLDCFYDLCNVHYRANPVNHFVSWRLGL